MKNCTLALYAGIGTALAIGLLAYIETKVSGIALLMAPFGATAVLVFGVPDSPLAQPKNVILGHLITAFIGIAFFAFVDITPLTLAIASGLGVSAMLLTKTTHPPAGANPLLIMLTGQGWDFLITPVLLGAVTVVLIGQLMKIIKSKFFKST